MQNYRREYPNVQEDEEHTDDEMPNLKFYLNESGSEPDGVTIEEFHRNWKADYRRLERVHSYIQWLFPLREPGMNYMARELTKKEIQEFCKTEDAKQRLIESYELMLDFYGIKLVNKETGEVKRAENWKDRFGNLDRNMHNNLRITRILKCLGELGFEHYKAPLVKFFLEETLVKKRLSSVKRSVLDYFVFAIRDKKQRRELIEYAYQHFEPKDKFVWCPREVQKRFVKKRSGEKRKADNSNASAANSNHGEEAQLEKGNGINKEEEESLVQDGRNKGVKGDQQFKCPLEGSSVDGPDSSLWEGSSVDNENLSNTGGNQPGSTESEDREGLTEVTEEDGESENIGKENAHLKEENTTNEHLEVSDSGCVNEESTSDDHNEGVDRQTKEVLELSATEQKKENGDGDEEKREDEESKPLDQSGHTKEKTGSEKFESNTPMVVHENDCTQKAAASPQNALQNGDSEMEDCSPPGDCAHIASPQREHDQTMAPAMEDTPQAGDVEEDRTFADKTCADVDMTDASSIGNPGDDNMDEIVEQLESGISCPTQSTEDTN
ncbi:opioid growth factor receptor isoform X2 [Amia ocellicauda]